MADDKITPIKLSETLIPESERQPAANKGVYESPEVPYVPVDEANTRIQETKTASQAVPPELEKKLRHIGEHYPGNVQFGRNENAGQVRFVYDPLEGESIPDEYRLTKKEQLFVGAKEGYSVNNEPVLTFGRTPIGLWITQLLEGLTETYHEMMHAWHTAPDLDTLAKAPDTRKPVVAPNGQLAASNDEDWGTKPQEPAHRPPASAETVEPPVQSTAPANQNPARWLGKEEPYPAAATKAVQYADNGFNSPKHARSQSESASRYKGTLDAERVKKIDTAHQPHANEMRTVNGIAIDTFGTVGRREKGKNGTVLVNQYEDAHFAESTQNRKAKEVPGFLRAMFDQMQEQVQASNTTSGATANVAYLSADADRTLTIANAGDARSVLLLRNVKTGEIETIRLSKDLSAADPDERARIEAAGDHVWEDKHGTPRVNGKIMVSRSLGDAEFKSIIHTPEITQIKLAKYLNNSKYEVALINSCDGLYDDILHEKDLAKLMEQRLGTGSKTRGYGGAAEFLANSAYHYGSHDNITVNFVRLAPEQTGDVILGTFDGHGGTQAAEIAANSAKSIAHDGLAIHRSAQNQPPTPEQVEARLNDKLKTIQKRYPGAIVFGENGQISIDMAQVADEKLRFTEREIAHLGGTWSAGQEGRVEFHGTGAQKIQLAAKRQKSDTLTQDITATVGSIGLETFVRAANHQKFELVTDKEGHSSYRTKKGAFSKKELLQLQQVLQNDGINASLEKAGIGKYRLEIHNPESYLHAGIEASVKQGAPLESKISYRVAEALAKDTSEAANTYRKLGVKAIEEAANASHTKAIGIRGAGAAIGGVSLAHQFIGEDATFNKDLEAGGDQATLAKATMATNTLAVTADATDFAITAKHAKEAKETASAITSAAKTATQETGKQAVEQTAEAATKKITEEATKEVVKKVAEETAEEIGKEVVKEGAKAAGKQWVRAIPVVGNVLATGASVLEVGTAIKAKDGHRAAHAAGAGGGGLLGAMAGGAAGGVWLGPWGALGGAVVGGVAFALAGGAATEAAAGDTLQALLDEDNKKTAVAKNETKKEKQQTAKNENMEKAKKEAATAAKDSNIKLSENETGSNYTPSAKKDVSADNARV